MLVLTRRIGEVIVIAGDIEVEILKIKGRQIRVGIKAPKEVSILRKEVSKKDQRVKT